MEDMLSSVRRLVSDELPRMPRADVPKAPPALVLTESQRIEPPMSGHNSRRKSLEDRIAELEAAVAQSSDDWEPDGSEDLEQHRPDHIVFRPSRPATRPQAGVPLRLSDSAKVVDERDATPAEKPLEPLVLVERKAIEPAFQETEEALQVEVETALSEAVSSAIADMTEDALTGDKAFEQALAEAVHADDGSDTYADASQSAHAAPPASIDVADIRPLISALIREELQGDLGERITRNVRKLVRQEIQRALTVREVE